MALLIISIAITSFVKALDWTTQWKKEVWIHIQQTFIGERPNISLGMSRQPVREAKTQQTQNRAKDSSSTREVVRLVTHSLIGPQQTTVYEVDLINYNME